MFGRIFVDIWVWRFHLGEYYVHWWLSDYSNDLFHVECFVVDSVFRGTGPFHLNCQIYVCRIVCSIPLLFCWCLRVYGEILCFICNTDSLCLLPVFFRSALAGSCSNFIDLFKAPALFHWFLQWVFFVLFCFYFY